MRIRIQSDPEDFSGSRFIRKNFGPGSDSRIRSSFKILSWEKMFCPVINKLYTVTWFHTPKNSFLRLFFIFWRTQISEKLQNFVHQIWHNRLNVIKREYVYMYSAKGSSRHNYRNKNVQIGFKWDLFIFHYLSEDIALSAAVPGVSTPPDLRAKHRKRVTKVQLEGQLERAARPPLYIQEVAERKPQRPRPSLSLQEPAAGGSLRGRPRLGGQDWAASGHSGARLYSRHSR